MSQTERGWADPKAVEQWNRVVVECAQAELLRRQVYEPTERELAAEEAQLP